LTSVQNQLQQLQAMGVQAIEVVVSFPVLYPQFYSKQTDYQQIVSFYAQVAAMVKGMGMKLMVENQCLAAGIAQAGWDPAPFYDSLNWTQYQQARAQMAVTVAQTMQPDYMVVLEEPDTEGFMAGQPNADTVAGSTSMLNQILSSLQQSGVAGMKVGAGVGTWQEGGVQGFIKSFTGQGCSAKQPCISMPLDFIDMHIYPINNLGPPANNNFLANALTIATLAHAVGKPVSLSQAWMWKVRNSEWGVLTEDPIMARDPFSFWQPLDIYFLQTMVNLANYEQMLYMAPFQSQYFSAYLTYDSGTQNLTPAQIFSEEGTQSSLNWQQAIYTSTALSFYNSIVAPADTVPPSTPGGLTGGSSNPTTASMSWNASTDNVGVAGYNILRNGNFIAKTALQVFQDSGLTEATKYTYAIEAFDLAGNISAPSLPINVTTADVTPPTAPANVVATAASCQKVTLTWSASTDNNGIGAYLVFSGVSPAALLQVGRTAGTTTSYTSYTLTEGTTYYYGVEAVDKSGNVSSMSAIVRITTPMPPGAPTNLVATPFSTSRIGLTWSAAASGGLPIQNYHVYRGTRPSNLSQVAIVVQPAYMDTSGSPATTYYYAVQAADTGRDLSPMSATVSATTLALPSAPTNLAASAPSKGLVSLTWTAAQSGMPLASYTIFRGSSPSSLTSLKVAAASQTSASDYTVSPGTTYYYGIQAKDTGGNISPMSAIVAVTTPH
jgi:fibronectin type 3 domain-containing protein